MSICYSQMMHCVGVSKGDDGIFYMSWGDFLKYFDGIDVCCRSRDMDDIQLDLYEDFGILGPFFGCIYGISGLIYVVSLNFSL